MNTQMFPPASMVLLGTGPKYRAELCDKLDGVELLTDLAWADLEALSDYLKPYGVSAKTTIFREGDSGDFLCVLLKGKVRVYKEDMDARDAALVSTESAGRAIGEMALIDGEPRSATCVTVEDSELVLLTCEAFDRLCHEHPALAVKLLHRIARLLSRRLRSTSGRLVEYLDS